MTTKTIDGHVCQEALDPEFVRFENGTELRGVLLSRQKVTIGGKPAIQYTLQRGDGSIVKFNGTAGMISKLRGDLINHFVSVTCIGEDHMVKRGDNYMKVFEIWFSVEPAQEPAADGLEITDADIPF